MLLLGCTYIQKVQKPTPSATQKPATTTKSTPKTSTATIDTNLKNIVLLHPLHLASNAKVAPFNELTAKMKMKGTMNGSTRSFSTTLRWKKGEKIWMSMSILGIEGVRILIRKDSVFILDKLSKKYWAEPYSYLEKKAGIAIPFTDLENLFLGNLFYTKYASKDTIAGNYVLEGLYQKATSTAKIDTINTLLKEISVSDTTHHRNLQAQFDDYKGFNNKWWSYKRDMQIQYGKNSIALEAIFDKIEIVSPLDYTFVISDKYTRAK
jgi:hypothetical protein